MFLFTIVPSKVRVLRALRKVIVSASKLSRAPKDLRRSE